MQETVVREFPRSRILTPRDVRGDYETLFDAVHATSYAIIEEARVAAAEVGIAGNGGGSSSGSGGGKSASGGGTEGGMKGGWPLVDDSRGKVLFVLDYQSTNRLCRPGIREVCLGGASSAPSFRRFALREVKSSRSPRLCKAVHSSDKNIRCGKQTLTLWENASFQTIGSRHLQVRAGSPCKL